LGIFEDRVLAWRRVVPLARLCHMQQACHKMEIGGVADRRLRLVRHQFDAVCFHHANIDRAAAGYSPDRVDALVVVAGWSVAGR